MVARRSNSIPLTDTSRASLPSATDILNSVSEAEYRTYDVSRAMAEWQSYKASHPLGGHRARNLTLTSSGEDNTKMRKNADHPNPMMRATDEIALNLSQDVSSGIVNTCAGCSTPGCRAMCNAESGKFGMPLDAATAHAARGKHLRTGFLVENPAAFGALLAHELRQRTYASRSIGRIPVARLNTWSDIPWHKTTLGPIIMGDMSTPHRDAIGEWKNQPALYHANYTKEYTLGDQWKSPDLVYPNNYLGHSVSELTQVPLIKQGLDEGATFFVPVEMKPSQEKPEELTVSDRQGRAVSAPSFDADTADAIIFHGRPAALGVLRNKVTPSWKGGAGNIHGFIRSLRPEGPSERWVPPTPVSVRPSRRQAFGS